MAHNKTTEPLIANVVISFMQNFFFKKCKKTKQDDMICYNSLN